MKSQFQNIKAILFDSGHTLNRPSTWHWFLPPRFYEIIDKELLKSSSPEFKNAMSKAQEYLNKNHSIKTEEEEFSQFREFYSILLTECKYPNINDTILDALARDNVYNDDKFFFFEDVEPGLKTLKERFALGIVSDTWPSLERVFINKGLRQYFSTFIMSSVDGSFKSEKRLFKLALEELGVQPSEAIFVDDSEGNLKAAKELGLIPVKIDRYVAPRSFFFKLLSKAHTYSKLKKNVPLITSLTELEVLLTKK